MNNHLTKSVLLMGVLACALLASSAQANRSVYLVVGNDNLLSASDQIIKDRFETAYGNVDVTVVLDENANRTDADQRCLIYVSESVRDTGMWGAPVYLGQTLKDTPVGVICSDPIMRQGHNFGITNQAGLVPSDISSATWAPAEQLWLLNESASIPPYDPFYCLNAEYPVEIDGPYVWVQVYTQTADMVWSVPRKNDIDYGHWVWTRPKVDQPLEKFLDFLNKHDFAPPREKCHPILNCD